MGKQIIIWGEHRTEELMALDVAEKLMQDKDLEGMFKPVEYQYWELFDYIPNLRRVVEGYYDENRWEKMKGVKSKYDNQLGEKYGVNILNLHDGLFEEGSQDSTSHLFCSQYISFIFPPAGDFDKPKLLLDKIAKQQGLPILVGINPRSFSYITAEFNIPMEIRQFSQEVEDLLDKVNANPFMFKRERILKRPWLFSAPDRNHPGYQRLLERNYGFIKNYILLMAEYSFD